jgi:hypothetical protein
MPFMPTELPAGKRTTAPATTARAAAAAVATAFLKMSEHTISYVF